MGDNVATALTVVENIQHSLWKLCTLSVVCMGNVDNVHGNQYSYDIVRSMS